MFPRIAPRPVRTVSHRPSIHPVSHSAPRCLSVPRRYYACPRDEDSIREDATKTQDQLRTYEKELCEARTLLFKYTKDDKIDNSDITLWHQHLEGHRDHRREDIRYHLKQEQDKLNALQEDLDSINEKIHQYNDVWKSVKRQSDIVARIKQIDLNSDIILDRGLINRLIK